MFHQQTAAASAATLAIPANLSQIQQGNASHGELVHKIQLKVPFTLTLHQLVRNRK